MDKGLINVHFLKKFKNKYLKGGLYLEKKLTLIAGTEQTRLALKQQLNEYLP